jgi:hypothetical protein
MSLRDPRSRPAWTGAVWHLFALLALTCLLAGPARAAQANPVPRIVLPQAGALHAGQFVDLRWAGGLPDCDELEILLVIEGPHGRTVQVSPEMDPRRGVFTWRVPELGRTTTARLSVRYERDGHEVEGEATALFDLVSAYDLTTFSALLPDSPGRAAAEHEGRAAAADRQSARAEEADPHARDCRQAAARTHVAPAGGAAPGLEHCSHARSFSIPPFVPARN